MIPSNCSFGSKNLEGKKDMTDIMAELFDQEEVLRSYVESERYEAAEEAEKRALERVAKEKIETAKRFLKMGKLSVEEVAVGTELTVEEVEELAGLPLV